MTHSTFYQPPPKDFSVSEGYTANTTKPPLGFEIFNPVGAGGYSSTAADMGRLGQALLNGGELDGARILKPETLALMWTPQFRASPDMPPIGMGFYQRWRNNLRWVGHQGDLIAFHSMFYVEPTQKLVFFVAYNSAGSASKARNEVIEMFSDRYYPAHPPQNFISLTRDELNAIQGTYQSTRRADSTKLKFDALSSQSTVSINKDGELSFEGGKDLRGHTLKFKPISKDLWQAVGEQQRLFAIRDSSGKIVRIAVDFPGVQEQRVPWYENQIWILPALISSVVILALVVIATLVRTGRRVFFSRRPRLMPQPGTVWLPWFTQLAAWLWILLDGAILAFSLAFTDAASIPSPAWQPYFIGLNWAIGLMILLSLFVLVSGIRVWTRQLRVITCVKFTLVALACLFLSWFAIHWNLISQVTRI